MCCVSGKPIMIVTEFMENGALDAFLKVRQAEDKLRRGHPMPCGSLFIL